MPGKKMSTDQESFLSNIEPRPFKLEGITDIAPVGPAIGPGSGGLSL